MKSTIKVRKRQWTRNGEALVAWMLDYKDHSGERQRPVVKHPEGPWKADDTVGIEVGKIHAMTAAQRIAKALDAARLDNNRVPVMAERIKVLDMITAYLEKSDESPSKSRGMLLYLGKMPAAQKSLATWTRQDSHDLVDLMARHLAQETLTGYWGVFKRAWRHAYNSEIIDRNPTTDIKARGGKASKAEDKHLRDHELEQLIATPFREDVRGIFLFMLVAGAYYADLGKFRRSNIVRMPDGTMRMSWKRSKTGRETWMAVTEELMQCATGDGDQLFPCLPWSIVYFNIQLKQWAFKAGLVRDGLPLQLSQKWARKTCGNNARQLTNDPFVLRDLMAHKELKSTQHYVQPNADEVTKTSGLWMRKVFSGASR